MHIFILLRVQYTLGVLHAFCCGGLHPFQGILKPQFFPFIYAQRMVGKNFYFFYILQGRDKVMKSYEICIFIASSRNQDVADPDWLSYI